MQLKIDGLFKKKLSIAFNQENTSSEGGLLLPKIILDQLEIVEKMGGIIHDDRNQSYVDHSLKNLLSQRLLQLIAGYEDLQDAKSLREDPMLKLIVNESPVGGPDLASAPTLCRLENQITIQEIHDLCELLVDLYLKRNRKRWKKQAKKRKLTIRLDLDPTDLETYGKQQLSLFNGYYRHTCYLPMVIADGDNGDLVTAFLRPGTKHAKFLFEPVMKRLLHKIEREYPFVEFEIRADSGFQCPEIFEFLESKPNVRYTIAMATNSNLEKPIASIIEALEKERKEAEENKGTFETRKIFGEIGYRAQSWNRFRRVVYQIEANSHRVEVRYMATNDWDSSAEQIKENYNQRANLENRIKELKTQSFGSRMSCQTFVANSFRFALSCFSLIVFQELKKKLANTSLAGSYVETIRSKLLKVSVTIQETTRRFILSFPKSYPAQEIWRSLLAPA